MKLSVIVPCFNEVNTLRDLLVAVKNCGIEDLEIIVVDDYSTDGTRDVLKNLEDKSIKVLYHERNRGKGAALRTGFKAQQEKFASYRMPILNMIQRNFHC